MQKTTRNQARLRFTSEESGERVEMRGRMSDSYGAAAYFIDDATGLRYGVDFAGDRVFTFRNGRRCEVGRRWALAAWDLGADDSFELSERASSGGSQ